MKLLNKIMALKLKLPSFSELPHETQKYFEICKKKIGYVPNVLRAYSHDIEQLNTFSSFYNGLMLAKTGLSPLEREMIAVVVSSKNHCYYCLTAHGQAVREYSGDAVLGEALAMNYKSANLNERHRSMLDFAVKLTLDPANMDENDRELLRSSGFTEKEIWEIASIASFFNMSNRMASAVDMQPNEEYHFQNREKTSN